MINNDCALMLRALNGCENYFEMMKNLIVKLSLSITGSRVLGLCGQKTPWRNGEIATLPRYVYQVSVEILILKCCNPLPNNLAM